MKICLGWLPLVFAALTGRSAEVTVQSGPAPVHLLELYTSEGCSSCPPAERWLSSLRNDPRLWKEAVPLAFHVDYWDYLGWKDPFSAAAWTQRQRAWSAAWGTRSVYTPGFVLDGREWQRGTIPAATGAAGILTGTLHAGGELAITYQPVGKGAKSWQAHGALLGFGLSTEVRGGENGGQRLTHDFVVLEHVSGTMADNGESARATLRLPGNAQASGLALWVTEAGSARAVQAAGRAF